jgi:hypothetical protein
MLRITGLGEGGQSVSVIDAEGFERAVKDGGALETLARPHVDPLELDAYAVARVG